MQFVSELKYMTSEEIQQSAMDMRQLLSRDKCHVNQRQFFMLQSLFPSCLKKNVAEIVDNDLLPADIDLTGSVIVIKCSDVSTRVYLPIPGAWDERLTWRGQLGWDHSAKIDLYHADHEPCRGISVQETKKLCEQYYQSVC